jgi:hypothetical protein
MFRNPQSTQRADRTTCTGQSTCTGETPFRPVTRPAAGGAASETHLQPSRRTPPHLARPARFPHAYPKPRARPSIVWGHRGRLRQRGDRTTDRLRYLDTPRGPLLRLVSQAGATAASPMACTRSRSEMMPTRWLTRPRSGLVVAASFGQSRCMEVEPDPKHTDEETDRRGTEGSGNAVGAKTGGDDCDGNGFSVLTSRTYCSRTSWAFMFLGCLNGLTHGPVRHLQNGRHPSPGSSSTPRRHPHPARGARTRCGASTASPSLLPTTAARSKEPPHPLPRSRTQPIRRAQTSVFSSVSTAQHAELEGTELTASQTSLGDGIV